MTARVAAVLLALLLLGLPGSAWAVVTVDGTPTTHGEAAGTSFSFSHTIGSIANGAVAVAITFGSNQANTVTVTVGGAAAAVVSGSDTTTTGTGRSALYCKATGATTGATTIAVTLTASDTIAIVAMSASGVNQTTPCNNGTLATVASSSWPNTLTITSAVGDLSFDVATDNSGAGSGAFTTNQTQQWYFSSNFFTSCFGAVATTPAASVAHTTSNTNSANAGTHSGANFAQAAAGGLFRNQGDLTGLGTGGKFLKDPAQYRPTSPMEGPIL